MIRIGICDDVPFYAEMLEESIRSWADKRSVMVKLEKFRSGEEVLFDQELQGDFAAVFLDIELGGMSGMETALKLRKENRLVSIIFVSGYEQYLKDTFRLYPCQFMEKPISGRRVYEALDQVIREQGLYHESFLFRYNRRTFNIDLERVLYFASEKRMIRVLMDNGREYTFYKKLDQLEEMLAGYNHHFVRIHKSYLINERQIEQYHAQSVVMRNGDVLAISRDKRKRVCQLHMRVLSEKC